MDPKSGFRIVPNWPKIGKMTKMPVRVTDLPLLSY